MMILANLRYKIFKLSPHFDIMHVKHTEKDKAKHVEDDHEQPNYKQEDEDQVIEAMRYCYCQFNNGDQGHLDSAEDCEVQGECENFCAFWYEKGEVQENHQELTEGEYREVRHKSIEEHFLPVNYQEYHKEERQKGQQKVDYVDCSQDPRQRFFWEVVLYLPENGLFLLHFDHGLTKLIFVPDQSYLVEVEVGKVTFVEEVFASFWICYSFLVHASLAERKGAVQAGWTVGVTWHIFPLSWKDEKEIFLFVYLVFVVDSEDDIVGLPEMALQFRPKIADFP